MNVDIPILSYRPDTYRDTDSIIVSPFQWNATPANTGPRLQYIANKLGQIVVAFPALEAVRNTKDSLDVACERLTVPIQKEYDPNSVALIGWGDSMAGMFISGMQNKAPGLFERILLRDSVNLTGPHTSPEGYIKVLGYQAFDALQGRMSTLLWEGSSEPVLPKIEDDFDAHLSNRYLHGLYEMHRSSKLVRSRISVTETLHLADDPQLPLYVVGFSRGLSGPKWLFESFTRAMEYKRRQAVQDSDDLHFESEILPGWHSRLIEANLALYHLQALKRMS